jgi:gem associated protein 2
MRTFEFVEDSFVAKKQYIMAADSETNFDGIEQMDAAEYLARVSKEAKRLPQVFISSALSTSPTKKRKVQSSAFNSGNDSGHAKILPIDGSAASLAYLISKRSSLTPPPSRMHLPSVSRVEWIDATIASFEELRHYLENCKARGIGGKETDRTPLPPMRDRPSWHIFCVGTDEANGNAGAYFGGEDDCETDMEEEGEDERHDSARWRVDLPPNGHAPTVRLLAQMDQVMVRRVLSHLTHYIRLGWPIHTGRRSEWVYALLAMLEKPVHRDDAAILFGLLKALTAARAAVDCEKDRRSLAKINVLIVLVGIYFEQGGGVAGVMTCSP